MLEKLGAEGFLSDYGVQMRRRDGSLYYASLNMSRLEMAGQEVLLGTLTMSLTRWKPDRP